MGIALFTSVYLLHGETTILCPFDETEIEPALTVPIPEADKARLGSPENEFHCSGCQRHGYAWITGRDDAGTQWALMNFDAGLYERFKLEKRFLLGSEPEGTMQ
jgi:hypothetical protein